MIQRDLMEDEKSTYAILSEKLASPLSFQEETYYFGNAVLAKIFDERSATNPMTDSHEIAINLLGELLNHIRTISTLSSLGYPHQAAIIAASVFEVSSILNALSNDESLAKSWLEHSDIRHSFMSTPEALKAGLENLQSTNPTGHAESEYKIYTQLCMCKHANPVFMQVHRVTREQDNTIMVAGPLKDDRDIRLAWFAIEHSTRHVFLSIVNIIDKHIIDKTQFQPAIDKITSVFNAVKQASTEKWQSGDPFPGQWKTFK